MTRYEVNHQAWARSMITFIRERGLEEEFKFWSGGWPCPVISHRQPAYAELLAHVAKAICRVLLNGGDPNQPAVRWNGTQMEPQEFPVWRDYRDEAVAAISACNEYDDQRRAVEHKAVERAADAREG